MARGSTRKGVTAATPPRVTLLSLPDEILALVFAALHGRYQHRKIGMPPSHHLRICKRLYTIARPIWLSVLVVPTAKTDEYCGAKMLEHAAALAHIRDLELQLEVDPPSWKLALFPHLANLQTLRLREAPVPNRHQAGESYSEEVMIVLENLANLSGMQILSPNTTLTHVSGNSIIRRLDLPISSQTMRGVCMLEHLTLRIDSDTDTTDCMYEWENLEAIEFVIDRQLSETPQLFLRKLLMQTGRTAVFERLCRFKITLWRSGPADIDICESLLAAFSRAPISDLELDYGPFHPFPDADDVPWTSLTKLTLRASLNLTELYRLHYLLQLLQKSPDLCDLTLIDFDWMGLGKPTFMNIDDPNLVASYIGFPALYTFIHLLRDSTAILRVCICRSTGNRVRWNRSSPTEEFQAEWYVVQR